MKKFSNIFYFVIPIILVIGFLLFIILSNNSGTPATNLEIKLEEKIALEITENPLENSKPELEISKEDSFQEENLIQSPILESIQVI